jgi:hypothetical protein
VIQVENRLTDFDEIWCVRYAWMRCNFVKRGIAPVSCFFFFFVPILAFESGDWVDASICGCMYVSVLHRLYSLIIFMPTTKGKGN